MKILKFLKYRKIIDNNRKELEKSFNLKIDNIYRLGTLVSIPKNKYDILISYKNSELDIYKQLDSEVKKTISNIDKFFIQLNLMELINIYSIDRIGPNLVEVILSFNLVNMVKVANYIRFFQLISGIFLFISYFINIELFYSVILVLFILFGINLILFKKLFI